MAHALFETQNAWVKSVVESLAPPEISVEFFHQHEDNLPAKLARADFMVTIRVKSDWVPHMTRCKLVQQLGVGYDSVDRRALHAAGIPLATTPQGTPQAVAEHVFMMMLALYRQTVPIQASMRAGEFKQFGWREHSHFLFGKTLGIIGLGRIGKRVARLAHAFDLEIIYNDLIAAPDDIAHRYDLTRVSFDDLLQSADIVTIHTPLTDLTRGFIGMAQFRQMKADALFINTSRGGTYDMDALATVLADGHLRGAGLDVWSPEPPPPHHPIFQFDRVIATPHMASGGVETHHLKAQSPFENMQRVLKGIAPINVIPYPDDA
jgi:phosphoglycerate dehydrogenase-like enzyme